MDDQRSFQSVECVVCHGTFDHNTATYYEEVECGLDGYVCDDCLVRTEQDKEVQS